MTQCAYSWRMAVQEKPRHRIHLYFRQLVGAFLLLYAAAFIARPDVGALVAAAELYVTTPQTLIVLFAVNGAIMLLFYVHPPLVALLSMPLVLLLVSAARTAIADTSIGWTLVVAHAFSLAMILRWAWRRTKEGSDD